MPKPLAFNFTIEETNLQMQMQEAIEKPSGDYERLRNKPTINGREIVGELELLASDSTYVNEDFENLTNVDEALNQLFAKVYYVEPKIDSFTSKPSATTYEIGTEIPQVEFNWKLNKEVKKQTLTGCTVSETDRTATYDGTTIKTDKTFSLEVEDEIGTKVKSNLSFSFMPNIYWGIGEAIPIVDSAFVLGLSDKQLKSSRNGNYEFNVTSGNYGYWCSPRSYGMPKCAIGGFETELELVDMLPITNASGYTQDYYIYRTPNAGLGKITMTIS